MEYSTLMMKNGCTYGNNEYIKYDTYYLRFMYILWYNHERIVKKHFLVYNNRDIFRKKESLW